LSVVSPRLAGMEITAVAGAAPVVGASTGAVLVERGRAVQARLLAVEAERLGWAAAVLAECVADAPALLHGSEAEAFARSLAESEIACTLGISLAAAGDLLALAERVTTVMPEVLTAISEARIDVARVRALVEATNVLDDATAERVATQLVSALDAPVWDGPSPRAWKARVHRAVMRADQHAAHRRRQRALADRRISVWAEADGIAVLQVRADATHISLIEQVLTDLAAQLPEADPDTGEVVTLAQRKVDALTDLCRRVADHTDIPDLPTVPVRRVHDLGLVLHTDTLFDTGPRRQSLGELRGLGAPTPLDATSARTLAQQQLRHGTAVQVLVVDDTGALAHVVRLTDPTVCDSRQGLLEAVRGSLAHPPPTSTDRYRPTTAITRHVLAEAPNCTFYDCPRPARRCDLDHDDPWPRGPTSITNLDPKCRRHHQPKTHALVRSHLHTGSGRGPREVTWTLRNGLQVTTRPEPLPGCGD
ncbi:MAG: DUF222 domain-containing protein, partial [Angustibacter sp.]